MDLEQIFLNVLREQEVNADLNHHEIDPPAEENHEHGYVTPFHTNEFKRIKAKWLKEQPDLSEEQMDNIIEAFNRKKNNLRPYREDITADGVLFQGVPNLPEVTSLKLAFPEFPADNFQKLKDLNSYTWTQIEFFTDRFNTEANNAEMTFNTEGDTEQQRMESAYNLWKGNWPSKIIDENGLIVHKISGKDEAIAFGKLQHMMNRKIGGQYNDWCITSANPGSTMYNNYRDRRSYYFTLRIGDKGTSKENDQYYMSVIQPSTGLYEGPYVVTPRPNGDQTHKTWDDVVKIYPQLQGKEHMFKFFPKTNKEKYESVLDIVNFIPGDKNNFIMQPRGIQNRYLESGRNINSLDAFKVLNKEQINSYIRGTNIGNYKQRFISGNHTKPFEILDFLKKNVPGKYNDIDNYIKGTINVPSGIKSVRNFILLRNFKIRFLNENKPNEQVLINEDIENIGVFDKNTGDFILPPVFIEKGRIPTYTEKFSEKYQQNIRNNFIVVKYEVSETFKNDIEGEIPTDTFYTVYLTRNMDRPGDEKYYCKLIMDRQAGDKLWGLIKK